MIKQNQRHRDRRPSTAAGPGCWAMGKIIFCTRLTSAAKAGQISFVPARRVQQTNFELFESPFTSVSTWFQQSAGPPLYSFCEKNSFTGHQKRLITCIVKSNVTQITRHLINLQFYRELHSRVIHDFVGSAVVNY